MSPMSTPPSSNANRTAKWLMRIFASSIVALLALAIIGVSAGQLKGYLMIAGFLYTTLCLLFLGVIFFVFVYGHVASSEEIENPKIDLFEYDKQQ